MKLSTIIEAMVANGAPVEAIVAVVKAHEAEQEQAESERREKNAERKRRQRSRNVTGTERDTAGHDVTSPPPCSPPSLSPTPPISPPPIIPPHEGKPRKRATRLPEDWKLPDDWKTYATANGLSSNDADQLAAELHGWSLTKPQGTSLDWKRTWQTWVRKHPKWNAGKPRMSEFEWTKHVGAA